MPAAGTARMFAGSLQGDLRAARSVRTGPQFGGRVPADGKPGTALAAPRTHPPAPFDAKSCGRPRGLIADIAPQSGCPIDSAPGRIQEVEICSKSVRAGANPWSEPGQFGACANAIVSGEGPGRRRVRIPMLAPAARKARKSGEGAVSHPPGCPQGGPWEACGLFPFRKQMSCWNLETIC